MRRVFAARGTEIKLRKIALVRLSAGGHVGWGECSPIPGFTQTIDAAWEELRQVLPMFVAGESRRPGVAMVRCALDQAHNDIVSSSMDIPLWLHLGGEQRPVVAGAVVSSPGDANAVEAQLVDSIERGYRHFKIKVQPGWDREPVTMANRLAPNASVGVDANGAYAGNIAGARALDDLGLAYIEQPLPPDDLSGHAVLRRAMSTPIILDEPIVDLSSAQAAIKAEAADALVVKPGKLGGLGPAVFVHNACQEAGIGVRIGGMIETDVGRAHSLALATLPGFELPTDLGPADRSFTDAEVASAVAVHDGMLSPPSGSGLGIQVNVGSIDKFAVDSIG